MAKKDTRGASLVVMYYILLVHMFSQTTLVLGLA